MKRLFVGHRGVGKSQLLKRHAALYSDIPHYDLDVEIEKRNQVQIDQLFKTHQEKLFRELEIKTYQQIRNQNEHFVMVLGAGFSVDKIDESDEVVFVSRSTDEQGRIFLNRPRLDLQLKPLDESVERFKQRELFFKRRADFIYHLPEGLEDDSLIEEVILRKSFLIDDAYYTLNVSDLKNIHLLIQNFKKIELRTDLLDKKIIYQLIDENPKHHWLISIRDSEKLDLQHPVELDCDIQFLHHAPKSISIVSTHSNMLSDALSEVKAYENKYHIKLCPLIESFEELRQGHAWQSEDPLNRSFLPRSHHLRWNWYRMLCKYNQKINFIRGFNLATDQPSLYQWLGLPKELSSWACVLGQPIHFSRSPAFHQSFFKKLNSFMLAVEISQVELKTNINWLQSLGLKQAAVTSPLKETANELCTEKTSQAEIFKSVNTLTISNNSILGHNTDYQGLKYLISQHLNSEKSKVVIWGGGGTLAILEKVLPTAMTYSSQTGQPRSAKNNDEQNFEILIWAAPRKNKTLWPPHHWNIKKVIDLNYTENSMGLEYAQNLMQTNPSVEYISGLEMFYEQARHQQEFWSQT